MERKIRVYRLLILGLVLFFNTSYRQADLNNTVTDYDGNVYRTVKIGTQLWMAENLKTTKYNNGESILLVKDIVSWHNLSTPAYSPFGDKAVFHVFYNWYAVNTGKLCPNGWHVPTDYEWTILENYLGGNIIAGGKMKESGTRNWVSPNTAASNESGFSALPGGPIGSDLYGYDGFWWSSTLGNAAAWYRGLNYGTGSISRNNIPMRAGFCVRCLKD